MPRELWVLVAFASLLMPSGPLLVLAGGIMGDRLSPIDSLKTLPIALFVVGAAVSVYPAVRLMGVWGRKSIFLTACFVLTGAALLGAYSTISAQFWLICLSGFLLGIAQAIVAQTRFAAMELVSSAQAANAASKVMLSGLVAAVLGPELVQLGDSLHEVEFAGGFILLAGLSMVAAGILVWGYANPKSDEDETTPAPLLKQFPKNKDYVYAVVVAATAYTVMSLVMTATPITMHIHSDIALIHTKEVIQGHVLAMFLPSLVSGWLLSRMGENRMILVGLGCYLGAIGIGLHGVTLLHFWPVLVLLGLGWNFMFVAATALVPKASRGYDRYRAQAFNDLVVVSCQAGAALGAGVLLNFWGWHFLLLACLPLICTCLILLAALKLTFFALDR